MLDDVLLESTLAAWSLPLTDEQRGRYRAYLDLLVTWNERMNLVAESTLADATRRHVLDALALAPAWEGTSPPRSLVDIGAGAGIPGIPLAILWPETQVTLVDSIGKKVRFLETVISELGLSNAKALVGRAEELGRGPMREQAELVTARAVAALPVLAEYCLPLCAVGGMWLAPKGSAIDAELESAGHAIRTLGGELRGVYDVVIPDAPLRSLVVVAKRRPTPRGYPRPSGVPAKSPL